jgi:cell division septation protein DedD
MITTILSNGQVYADDIPAEQPERSSSVNVPLEVSEEFEFVMGARQMAALAFVAIAALALFSGISYLAGKAAVQLTGAPLAPIELKLPQPAPPQLSVGDQFATYAATITPKEVEKPAAVKSTLPDLPLFGEAQSGSVYMQMAAVEKSVAGVFVEGLRAHGLSAFAAPAPTGSMYRVLIGPLPDPDSFQKAKAEVDKMGLSTFARQYQR